MAAPSVVRRSGRSAIPTVDATIARVRLESSLAAYRAALEWLQRLPAAEAERRIAAKLADVAQLLDAAVDARDRETLRAFAQRTAPARRRAALAVLAQRDHQTIQT